MASSGGILETNQFPGRAKAKNSAMVLVEQIRSIYCGFSQISAFSLLCLGMPGRMDVGAPGSQVSNHNPTVEMAACGRRGRDAHFGAERRIIEEPQNGVGQLRRLPGWYKQARPAVFDQLDDASTRCDDYRSSTGQGLRYDIAKRLLDRRMNHDVGRPVEDC